MKFHSYIFFCSHRLPLACIIFVAVSGMCAIVVVVISSMCTIVTVVVVVVVVAIVVVVICSLYLRIVVAFT